MTTKIKIHQHSFSLDCEIVIPQIISVLQWKSEPLHYQGKRIPNTEELQGLNTDGSFTIAVSNSFLDPLEQIPLLQSWDNLGRFSLYIEKWYIMCTHSNRLVEAILIRTHNIPSYLRKSKIYLYDAA